MNREETVATLFSGSRVPLVLSVTAVGVVALRFRHVLLDAIDRRFFREQYDARQILTLLVDRIRSIQEVTGLASLVSREIDLALHLEGIALMVLDLRSNMLADPRNRARKLDANSALAQAISNASDPLEVDLEDTRSSLVKLPEKDRHWLVDSGFRLIVPILARDGALLGIVGLGEKKSGLPFLKEDRQLLHAIASSAAWVLELEQGKSHPSSATPQSGRDLPKSPKSPPTPGSPPSPPRNAPIAARSIPPTPCSAAPAASAWRSPASPTCSRGSSASSGGSGWAAWASSTSGADLALGRQVAIKTLRRVSPRGCHAAAARGAHGGGGLPLPPRSRLWDGDLAGHADAGPRAARRRHSRPAPHPEQARSPGDPGAGDRHGRRPRRSSTPPTSSTATSSRATSATPATASPS